MTTHSTEDIDCTHCGRPLREAPFTLRAELHMPLIAEHDSCGLAAEGYERHNAFHQMWCHVPNCQRGPVNPFEPEAL